MKKPRVHVDNKASELNLLFVHQGQRDVEATVRYLQQHGYTFNYDVAQSPEQMGEVIKTSNYNLIVADGDLPHFGKPSILSTYRDLKVEVPLIVHAPDLDEEEVIAAMREGIYDVVTPEQPYRLVMAIERVLREREKALQHEVPAPVNEPDFKTLFENAPGLYMVLDRSLRVVAASDAYLHATLTRREDIVGRYIFEVFPDNPDDPSADAIRNSLASFRRVLQSGVTDVMIVQRHDVRRPDSEGGGFEVRYWSPVNSPVHTSDGSVAYVIHRVENVTEFMVQKQQGAEQAKQSDALRERATQIEADLYARSREVAETSRKLKVANEELARLYEKARELDELKSQFFANVSHELRTPLTLILGPVHDLLGHEALDERARNNLLVVQRNARLLQRHVNDLLDIAKLEAGRMRMHYVRTDLSALVRLAASHFETVAADCRIRFVVDTPAALPSEVDSEKIERILINLLSNAFKFTPDGGAIGVTLGERSGHALIRVQDSGPGVPVNLREAIFERFRQGEGSAERHHGGTGLGLAIVREFVSLHGGTVEVTEAPGGGALFSLELPLAAPAETPVASETVAASGEIAHQALDELGRYAVSSSSGPSDGEAGAEAPRVLVVEDNPDMNAFLADALGRHYRVSRAFDGREGLAKAMADPPDLIIADIMMPGLSGDRMVEELRHHSAMDDVPIVLLTAKADDELRIRLLSHGVQDFIHKPFSVEEVLARVGGLLAERQRTGRRIRQSEERLRLVVAHSPDIAFSQDLDLRYTWIHNPAVPLSDSEVIGKTDSELLPPGEAAAMIAIKKRVLTTGERQVVELQLSPGGREARWYEAIYEPQVDAHGRTIGLFGYSRDITERKQAAEALKRAYDELEVRVQQRTQDLAQTNQLLRQEIADRQRMEEVLRSTADALGLERDMLAHSRGAMQEVFQGIEAQKLKSNQVLASAIDRVVKPRLAQLREKVPRPHDKLVDVLRQDIDDIIHPFLAREANPSLTKLAPRELEVCRLIRGGASSQEIASVLGLTPKTVLRYRETIRRKLGLTQVDVNLRSYLHSLGEF